MATDWTMRIEEFHMPPFAKKIPVSIERGKGVYVWTEEGRKLLDFTAGWGVTCLGHAHPVIVEALKEQGEKIMQNPNSGLTYSPARARLLSLMLEVLPSNLTRIFFSNSGAEANDAAIKLARKVTGRLDVISSEQSFHGRTISTASATGQANHRERFNPLMPNYRFVPYNDARAVEENIDSRVAAVILEPIQGEGGVHIPDDGYLEEVSRLCRENGTLLILDEIQTGFGRTGAMFATPHGVEPDIMTMAKGIAGGFPFGAFAMSEAVSDKLELGDHGGTYSGNPLGCAVSYAVIRYLIDNRVVANVIDQGRFALMTMNEWKQANPDLITEVRGKGLLTAVEFKDEKTATEVNGHCLAGGLLVQQTQKRMLRVFPALNITRVEMEEGLAILGGAIRAVRP
jgi:acetylornithine/N-succinyldiaminopimelate aminotransferase